MLGIDAPTRVFISHAKEQASIALKLKDALELRGFTAWAYEKDLLFGGAIAEEIRKNISNCDHFLVVLSPEATRSDWVARELGLALVIRRQNGSRPQVIGVCDRATTLRIPKSIRPRRFGDGTPLRARHDFSSVRYFDFSVDEITSLSQQLRIAVDFVAIGEGSERDLLARSFDCYRHLFPVRAERDAPADIFVWLEESRAAEAFGSPWREIYAVLHTGREAVGMAFLSAHLERHWGFGNYFGVLPGWRQDGRAETFLAVLKHRLKQVDPESRGILFEVEPVDPEALSEAARSTHLRGVRGNSRIRDSLRRLRRLFLYARHGARWLVDASGDVVAYRQPAMSRPLRKSNEVSLVLMAMPLRSDSDALGQALDFIYDDLYADAYGGAGVVAIPGYRKYVSSVKAGVQRSAEGACRFVTPTFPPGWSDLLLRAREEGLERWLAL